MKKISNLLLKMTKIFSRKNLRRLSLVAISVIVVLAPIAISVAITGNTAFATWYDDSFGYRKSIAISTHTAAENNVYIEVTISNTNTLVTNGQLQSSCQDMRFTKQNGELLPYYIVSGCNSASTVVHIYFDIFPAGAQTIYFYYGNPTVGAGGKSSDFTTEAASYTIGSTGSAENAPTPVAYWKFDDGTGTSATDSTTNANTGTLGGTTVPTWQTEDQCVAGKCLYFDGSTSKVTGSIAALNVQTVSFWVRPNTIASQGLISLNDGSSRTISTDSSGVISANNFTSPTYYINGNATTNPTLVANEWIFVSITTGTGVNSGTAVTIGTDGTNFQKGYFDEVKFYPYARSTAQIATDYNARSNLLGASSVSGQALNNNPSALNNGLIGYWKMDEASWTNNCSATSVLDSSGNGYNGKACPNPTGPTGGAAGKFGNAGLFDGSNDYVDTSNFFNQANGNHTYAAWINPTNTLTISSATDSFLDKTEATSNLEFAWYINRGLCIYYYTFIDYFTCYPTTLTAGTWYHIAATQDGFDIKLFLNGALVATGSTFPNGYATNNVTFQIGRRAVADQYFAGSIDEVRVYNRALSAADVSALYNFASGPVGYWNFEEGSGSTANDRSGNAYTGTWNGTLGSQWSPGKYGIGGNFNGTDTYVGVANSFYNSGVHSISAWVKGAAQSDRKVISIANSGTSTPNFFLGTGLTTTNKLRFFLRNGAGGILKDAESTTTVFDSNWHHIEFTNNKGTAKLYVDGVQDATDFSYTPSGTVTLDRTGFGLEYIPPPGSYFTGYMDDIRIYNYVRTPSEVISDMNAGHPAVGSPVGSAVGYWKFDEGADGTCTGGTNDACNSGNQGSTLDGAQSGMAVPATATSGWTNGGKFSRALVFDGTNDYLNMGNPTALQITGNITVSAWINVNTLPTLDNYAIVLEKGYNGTIESYTLQLANRSGIQNVEFYSYNGTIHGVQWAKTLTTGTWYHLVGTWDGATWKVYLDGVLGSSTADTTGPLATAKNVSVGAGDINGTISRYFQGSIDEVKVYNYALTADQVKIDMNRGSTQVLGSLSDNSSYQKQAANQEYCVPGDTTSCVAPVGRWDFEQGTGTNIFDTSSNGFNGTWTGSASHWVPGKMGKGGNFAGATDYATVTGTSALRPTSVTVEAWVKTTGPMDSVGGDVVTMGDSYIVRIKPDSVPVFIIYNGTNWNEEASASISVVDGLWHHLAGVKDATNNRIKFYVDGVLVANNSSTSAISYTLGSDLLFGRHGNGATTVDYTGVTDNIKIFNYARTNAQIAWDYNNGAPLAHWKFDECQGTTANNSVAGGTAGTITIGASGAQTTAGTCVTPTDGTGAWYDGKTGKFNYSLDFDGTDDFVSVAGGTAMSPTNITAAMWLNPSSTIDSSDDWIVFLFKSPASGSTPDWEMAHFAFQNQVYFAAGGATAIGTASLQSGTWYHLVGTYDGTTSKIYVNGILAATTAGGTTITSTAGDLQIGRKNTPAAGAQFYTPGQFDDVRIYNYPLTATQVKNLMNQGSAVRYGPSTGAP